MPTTIINLTPHAVYLIEPSRMVTIEPSGQVARVQLEEKALRTVRINGHVVKLLRVEFGPIIGLPDPAPDTFYLVSPMVAQAAQRPDLITPFNLVKRDGRTVGCRALAQM